jgi:hypothetical protein
MPVPQVYRMFSDGARVLAMSNHVNFLKEHLEIPEDCCTISLKNNVNEEHKEAFFDLLAVSDGGANCIMTDLGPRGYGTPQEALNDQREAAFKGLGEDVYKKGATFL